MVHRLFTSVLDDSQASLYTTEVSAVYFNDNYQMHQAMYVHALAMCVYIACVPRLWQKYELN
jgi:hypothetical protein